MKKSLCYQLPKYAIHLLCSYIPSTDSLYKGYTTVDQADNTTSKTITIYNVEDNGNY